jgi:hypothetical protein
VLTVPLGFSVAPRVAVIEPVVPGLACWASTGAALSVVSATAAATDSSDVMLFFMMGCFPFRTA